jgi:hypothetical protein
MSKTAELSGTHTMPAGQAVRPQPETSKMVLKKTGTLSPRVEGKDHHGGEKGVCPEVNETTPGEQAKSLPQAKVMKPHVDVSGFDPPKMVQEKKAQVTALDGRYPLDDYAQVKTACEYFNEWDGSFSPADRHAYAVNTLKRAEELGIEPSEALRKHGSVTYAPLAEVKVALEARKTVVDETHQQVLDKIAGIYGTVQPMTFAMLLEAFDKEAGINHLYENDEVPDPYYSTFGFTKRAEFSETIGNMTVSEMDLEYLANKRLSLVKNVFTEPFAEEFRKNPVDIYKSMPVDQRKILANMAREQRAGAPGSG